MIDEKTFTATLRELADGATVPTDPAAGARRRAGRIRRRRAAAGATGMLAAVAVVAVGVPSMGRDGPAHGGPTPLPSPPDRAQFHATSAIVPIGSVPGVGDFFVYWDHDRLCSLKLARTETGAECGPVRGPSDTAALRVQETAFSAAVAVARDDVASATVTLPNGEVLTARLVDGEGFPHRVAVVADRRAAVHGRWLAYDAAGRSLPTVERPHLLISRVVDAWPKTTAPCDRHQSIGPVVLSADGRWCYGLDAEPIPIRHTVSSTAVFDPQSRQWMVQLQLTRADARRFAQLTRQVSRLPGPRNQLVFLVDGERRSVTTVVEEIRGGMLQLSVPGGREQPARDLANELDSR